MVDAAIEVFSVLNEAVNLDVAKVIDEKVGSVTNANGKIY